MKTTTKILAFLMLCSALVFAAHSAFAGCEVGLDNMVTTSNPPGTKFSGPITVFFQCSNESGCDYAAPWQASMYFFIRLQKGSDLYQFSGGPYAVVVPTDLQYPDPTEGVQGIIGDFFTTKVIPTLYPGPDCDLDNHACFQVCWKICMKACFCEK